MKTNLSHHLIAAASLFAVLNATAQEDNYVPNGSFENSDLRKL